MKRTAIHMRNRKLGSDYLQSMRLWTNFFAASGAEYAAICRHVDHSDKDVLDIGCGNGRLSIKLAEQARSVRGVDLDARLIEFATDYALTNHVKNLAFAEMSALCLDYADASFDLVLMPWMLHMLKGNEGADRLAAMAEVKRVLRPGGSLIVFGLWGDCDYDRIARHFVSRREHEIEPVSCYEQPLKSVFGEFSQEKLPDDRSYSFIFPDCGVAVEAFTFAFSNWYEKKMADREINHLRHLLHNYGWGPHIELKTKGAVYICTKSQTEETRAAL
jgi:ubiquinone/menaquinone biosynthesis C-methylase UbiE